MGSWKGWVLAVLIGSATAPVLAQGEAREVDLAPYLRSDALESIKISPDGKHYAATVPLEDRTVLVILRRSDKQFVAKATGSKDSVIADYWWANDERVVVAIAQRLGSRDAPYRTGELHAIDIDGGRARILVGRQPEVGLVDVYGDGGNREYGDFIDRVPGDTRSILIGVSAFSANPQTQVETVDVYTGRRKLVTSAPVRRATLITDTRGQVRLAEGRGDDNYSKLYHRDNDDSEWTQVNDQASSGHYEWPLGFSADAVTAYLQVSQAKGPDAIVAWNTRTGERKEVLRDADVDPYALLFDRDGRTLIGAQYMTAGVRSRFFDEAGDTARAYRRLETAFPDSTVTINSFTSDGRIALARVWNDRMPGDYYLYDTQARTANAVFAAQQWFDPAKMPMSREVTLRARDGLALRGYLTLPRDAAQPLPMVVMPHGGPFGVFDQWQFDSDSQMLAEAGYAVLRVNYRGSGNYGLAFRQAGARQWGGAMQDDLTDATQWAVAQNIADPKRICIYGGSYGGYAALMGVAKEPDLYRCAVGYVGVYDLEAMHRDDSRVTGWLRNWVTDWVGERDDLAARSPTTLAQRIKVPVMLAAGGQDTRAPIAHSKKMERALRSAGTPVETLYFTTEGHGFYTEPHRREFYTRLLDFLARHIGGARAKDSGEVRGTQ